MRSDSESQLDPGDPDGASRARRLAADAARRLGPARWQMLQMVYGSRLSQQQIARRLGLPTTTVSSEIARSLQLVAAVVCEQP